MDISQIRKKYGQLITGKLYNLKAKNYGKRRKKHRKKQCCTEQLKTNLLKNF